MKRLEKNLPPVNQLTDFNELAFQFYGECCASCEDCVLQERHHLYLDVSQTISVNFNG